jgi:short-subunit dehydrogenase
MNVIITGAGKGIGKALAKKFAQEERITLYIISRTKYELKNLRKECLKINPSAVVVDISADLTRIKSHKLLDFIDSKHIDILINNAGLLVNKPFLKLSEKDILSMIDINFLVPVRIISGLSSLFGGAMPTHVINISSMGGFQGSTKFPGLSIYSATKAALAVFTECLAVEFSGKNVFFNCLALGSVQTEMFSEAFPGHKASASLEDIAHYIAEFSKNGYKVFNGKIIPVSSTTP